MHVLVLRLRIVPSQQSQAAQYYAGNESKTSWNE